MYIMRRHLLFLALLLVLPTAVLAQGSSGADRNFLVVETKDHVLTTYMLADKPEVSFKETDMHVVSAKGDVTYKLSDVLRFTYKKLDPSGISEQRSDQASIDYDGGVLIVSGIKAGCSVGVYTMDGKPVQQLNATRTGTYRISLSSLPQGVYLVKADNITYKIMKR